MPELSSDDLDWIHARVEESLADLRTICESIGEVGGRLYGIERVVKLSRQRAIPSKRIRGIRRLLRYLGI